MDARGRSVGDVMGQQATGGVRIEARETLSDGWFRLEKVTFRQDGIEDVLDREVYHNGPGVAVLPVDRTRGTVLLVRQLRIAAAVNNDAPFLVELCAGMVDGTDAPAEAIAKEAEQELGYRLRGLRPVMTLYMSPGASAEKLHLFAADYAPEDRIATGGGLEEEGEQIRVLEVSLERAWAMLGAGQIVDGKTVLMLQHERLRNQA